MNHRRRHITFISVFSVLALFVSSPINESFAQGSAGTGAAIESRHIIDIPTAGIIGNGVVAYDVEVYQGGGLLAGTAVGLFNRALFGISFGGGHLLGTEKPDWNPLPGFEARIRLLDETIAFPAMAVGFSSQGHGTYLTDQDRYLRKSPGFYAVLSKNYSALGFLGFHGGINYSLERADGNRNPDLFAGAEKTIGSFLSVITSYRGALNDNGSPSKGRGYLDAGISISPGKGFTFGISVRDLLNNRIDDSVGDRILLLEYVN
jgi:hypothetical protein